MMIIIIRSSSSWSIINNKGPGDGYSPQRVKLRHSTSVFQEKQFSGMSWSRVECRVLQRISLIPEEDEKQKKPKKLTSFALYNLILDFLTKTHGPFQTLQMQFL